MIADVSVVVPCYNEARNPLLEATFASIACQLDAAAVELVVIDDGSDDGTPDLVEAIVQKSQLKAAFKLIRLDENTGIANALNVGITAATGRFILRLDCGDIALPGRLQQQLTYLNTYNEVQLVGGLTRWIDSSGSVVGEHRFNKSLKMLKNDFRASILYRNTIVHTTWMARKQFFEVTGGYNSAYFLEDYELLARAAAMDVPVGVIPAYLTHIYRSDSGISSPRNRGKAQKSLVKIKSRYFLRLVSIRNAIGLLKSYLGLVLVNTPLSTIREKSSAGR
jgi:glycosyltransferase involved in cell wall biosynthesis